MSEQSETPRQALLNASDEYSTAQGAVEHALEELFGDNSILGIGWDSYDSSLEIYVWQAPDLCPTHEQVDSVLALGFVQFWINYQDGTERHCSKASVGARHACTHNRWDAYNNGHLKTRKLERELSEVTRERDELRGKKWTQPEAQRLLDFQDAAAQGDINEAYNAIYWLVAGRAENQFKIWEEVTALATPPEK